MMELSRPLTEQQIHYIMKEILKALNFLHGKNVIHRDLKAGNVLLTSDARVKLGKLIPRLFLYLIKTESSVGNTCSDDLFITFLANQNCHLFFAKVRINIKIYGFYICRVISVASCSFWKRQKKKT